MYSRWLLLTAITLTLMSCAPNTDQPIKIALNPWPGYEFLFLAQSQGYFEEAGLHIELVPFGSLADTQRAYISGRVDGMASTIIEALQSQILSGRPLKIVMVPDYSDGGDVVVAMPPVESVADLRGKSVGAEVTSLGIYMLHRTLASTGLSIADINLKNIEQRAAESAFDRGEIDAFVTYPPYSVPLKKREGMRTIFTSANIPQEIMDTVAVAEDIIQRNPQLVTRLLSVWQRALDYADRNPDTAIQIMSDRQGITPEEFRAALDDLHILDATEQHQLYRDPDSLQDRIVDVCHLLSSIDAVEYDCANLPDLVYRESRQ